MLTSCQEHYSEFAAMTEICNVCHHQVDKEALSLMSEKELEEMGLVKGHRLKVKSFIRGTGKGIGDKGSVESRLQTLKNILHQGRGSKRTGSANISYNKTKDSRKATLKVEFGWKNFCTVKKRYIQRKKNNGGGTRTLDVRKNATMEELLQLAKELFFPGGISPAGREKDMMISMGNYNGVVIKDSTDSVPLTAQAYKEQTGFHSPRFYLLTKLREDLFCDTSSDEELNESAFAESTSSFTETLPPSDGLIGTSAERQELFDELQQAVEASIASDRAKETAKEHLESEVRKAKEESLALQRLRQSREQRVPDEPREGDPYVLVSVRHIHLGGIRRKFAPTMKMLAVYDWVGSLTTLPRYFSLSAKPDQIIYPEENLEIAQGLTLCMMETEDPVQLCAGDDDDDVRLFDGSFSRDGDEEETLVISDDEDHEVASKTEETVPTGSDEQTNDAGLLPIAEKPPLQLLQEDDLETPEQALAASQETVRQKVQEEIAKLTGEESLTISRHEIVKELLKFYQDPDILTKNVIILLKDEMASGDGVRREAYSEFWDSFLSMYCEGSSQFAISMIPALQIEDYEALGRIITHQLVMCGTFPVQIAEAQMKQAIFGDVSDDCLISSFFKLLPEKEATTLQSAMDDSESAHSPFPANEVMDIMASFGATSLPSKQNIRKIVLDAAKSEMICKPYLALVKVREGMGPLWSTFERNEVEALYACSSPTSAKVIDCLHCLPRDSDEQRVFNWLCRYINSTNQLMLRRFLRFCTATDVLIPGTLISVRFENMVEIAMRPRARTCFRIFTLPKNYHTFTQLRQQLDYFFQNKELWDLHD